MSVTQTHTYAPIDAESRALRDGRPHDSISREDRSFSMVRANVYVLLWTVPLAMALFVPFWYVWGDFTGADWNLGFAAVLFFGGVVAHEVLHGLAWMVASGKPVSAIKLGFQWKTLTPYAHCTEPLDIRTYRIGAAVPGIVLGIVPALIGLATGHAGFLVFGFLFTLAAGGDALILWSLRDVPAGALVEDHPDRAGCYIIPPSK